MKKILSVLLLVWAFIAALAASAQDSQQGFRSDYHFAPKVNWMNDPNGLVYLNGRYHLYFQNNPYSNRWGPMHWGHAISTDLVHWQELPIALFPGPKGTIFSGSAVFDKENTSGFGTKENPPLVAIFTLNNHFEEYDGVPFFQSQGIAYSLDGGATWSQYTDNPVLRTTKVNDFRDPKVFWYEPDSKWVMSLAVKDHIEFYSSKNLKTWSIESDFGMGIGAHGGVWECPDLIKINVEGQTGLSKYVLLVSINPGGPNGGSATQYFVGDFDGKQFVLDKGTKVPQWLDYGRDNYAAVSWSNLPKTDAVPLIIGWMSNWSYAENTPVTKWRGTMTLPRALSLRQDGDSFALYNFPALDKVKQSAVAVKKASGSSKAEKVFTWREEQKVSHIRFALSRHSDSYFEFSNGLEKYLVKLDVKGEKLIIDRDKSGNVSFDKSFVGLQYAPLPRGKEVVVDAYLDRTSVELFINGGEVAVTNLVFPERPYAQLTISSDDQVDRDIEFYSL